MIEVNVLTMLPFVGHLYVPNYYENPKCKTTAQGTEWEPSRTLSLTIPLESCGVQKQFLVSWDCKKEFMLHKFSHNFNINGNLLKIIIEATGNTPLDYIHTVQYKVFANLVHFSSNRAVSCSKRQSRSNTTRSTTAPRIRRSIFAASIRTCTSARASPVSPVSLHHSLLSKLITSNITSGLSTSL